MLLKASSAICFRFALSMASTSAVPPCRHDCGWYASSTPARTPITSDLRLRVCRARRAEKSSRIPHRRARGTADPQSRGRGKRSLYSRRNYRCGASGRSSEHQFVESACALQSRFFEIPDHRAAVPGKIHRLVPLDGPQRGRAGISSDIPSIRSRWGHGGIRPAELGEIRVPNLRKVRCGASRQSWLWPHWPAQVKSRTPGTEIKRSWTVI